MKGLRRIATPSISYDRRSRRLIAAGPTNWAQARLMQASSRMLAPFGYLGVSRVHAGVNGLLRPLGETVIRDGRVTFGYPSNDYYWNRLLDASWDYEPEIEYFLRLFANAPFAFIDLGANFGYWTSQVASGEYGEHSVIAVEPATSCVTVLMRNVERAQNPVVVHQRVIDEGSGEPRQLYGDRHAGYSMDGTWHGASSSRVEGSVSISVDDVFDEATEGQPDRPVVVKLDIEGAELSALKGAQRTVAASSIFIIEDCEKGIVSDAIEYAFGDLGMHLFVYQHNRLRRLQDLSEILLLKQAMTRFQTIGLNLFATKSPYWLELIDKSEASKSREQST